MRRLVAVSNRTARALGNQAGGLAVAVDDALVETGGVWFGWSGEIAAEKPRGVRLFSEGGIDYAVSDLTADEHEHYYLGYANRALWPICHYRVDLAVFHEEDFAAYEAVNQRFARLLAPQLKPDDIVWIHDYHFFLLGDGLRREGWDGPIGFFLHTPFPAPEIFQAVPEHARLARALCSCDLVGFQTRQDAENFRRYLTHCHGGVEREDGTVEVFNTRVRAQAHPIGIDAADFQQLTQSDGAQRACAKIERFLGDRDLIIGVDRMDYSKGLPQRFEAVAELFVHHPEFRSKVSFTQIAPPSRSTVEEYRELSGELNEMVGRINGEYGDLDWIPIRYLARSYGRDELAGLYRFARIGLVTPLRDGMNLVAKEYVAAQNPDDPGVLILSRFAGAAEQLKAAVQVNPHDPSAMADAIKSALTMSLEERRQRHAELLDCVQSEDVRWWRRNFLAALDAACRGAEAAPESTRRASRPVEFAS